MLNHNSLYLIYCSLILPYLTYCVEIWGSTFKTTIDKIVLQQKRAIRIINKAGYYDHTNPLFLNSHVLKFRDLVYYRTMQIMFKVNNKTLPDSVHKFFIVSQSKYELRDGSKFMLPKAKKEVKRRCISFKGVQLWNSADLKLKQCTSFVMFKKSLCAFIFRSYGCN